VNLLSKENILNECFSILNAKIKLNESELQKLNSSQNEETKSSAGDKYETSREMMQRERDNLQNNLLANQQLLAQVKAIDTLKTYITVDTGALVETTNGLYFIAIGLGKITVNTQTVFVVSKSSPVGQVILGKKKGEQFTFQQQTITVLDIQ
jgi:transcription elongation GreA/GreB family factor